MLRPSPTDQPRGDASVGIDVGRVRGVLAAVAPIVGTARVASATGKIAEALDVVLEEVS